MTLATQLASRDPVYLPVVTVLRAADDILCPEAVSTRWISNPNTPRLYPVGRMYRVGHNRGRKENER